MHRLAVLAFLLAALGGSSAGGPPLAHDAYVWQRAWTPAVAAAVRDGADMVGGWRVLGAAVDAAGRLVPVTPDWPALADSGRPVILVVRIDTPQTRWDPAALRAGIMALAEAWRGQGVRLAGVEIDHDSPTGRLGGYGGFLRQLRAELDPALKLSVTALPAWLGAAELDAVLAAADEVVLQVHAVARPRPGEGLFSRSTAMLWMDNFSARTSRPFRLALPAYGTRVSRDADGSIVAVESEAPTLAGGVSAEELMVSPREVAALLEGLGRQRPRNLAGVVWFRLPTAADRRAWSLGTLRAVIAGAVPEGRAEVVLADSGVAGAMGLAVLNVGAADVRLPRRLGLPPGCGVADGANGYERSADGAALVLRPGHERMLHEGRQVAVGWARCPLKAGDIHVEP